MANNGAGYVMVRSTIDYQFCWAPENSGIHLSNAEIPEQLTSKNHQSIQISNSANKTEEWNI